MPFGFTQSYMYKQYTHIEVNDNLQIDKYIDSK